MKERRPDTASIVSIAIGLVVLVAAVFGSVSHHEFVDFDDGEYVYENPFIRDGLTLRGVGWALTSTYAANWHPLTWISHMADIQMFGLDAGAHHVVNLALHAIATIILFLVLRTATGALWRSAIAAALFAMHPLHVESVAWVAERKDVLSTVFWFLTLGAYVRYTRAPSIGRYAVVAIALALGLLSKPMLVTVPFVLLLLDDWPLERLRRAGSSPGALILEKVPLAALVVMSCVATLIAQSGGNAVATRDDFPLASRVANAIVSYGAYLAKAVYPRALSVFYPHPASVGEHVSATAVVLSLVVIVLISVGAVWAANSGRRYVAFGWLWYLGTLFPVIGVVQVGSQAMADRYTYVPLVGIFVAVVWGVFDLARGRMTRILAAAGAAVSIAALSLLAWQQVQYWRDNASLYTHAIAVTEKSFIAWNNLGMHHLRNSDPAQAFRCFQAAIAVKPDYGDAQYNEGVALGEMGRTRDAVLAFERAVRLDPANADGWGNLGIAYRRIGNFAAAINSHRTALRLRPNDAIVLYDLVLAYVQSGDRGAAAETLTRLRSVDPARAEQLERMLLPSTR